MRRFTRALLILSLGIPLLSWAPASTGRTVEPVILQQSDNGNPAVKVWVNTASGVYHCPNTRWYGKTKQGEYMTQAEAQKKGYRPAYGKVCR